MGGEKRSRGGSVVHPAGVGTARIGVRAGEVMGTQGGIGSGEVEVGVEGVEGDAEAQGGVPSRGEGLPCGGPAGVMRRRGYIRSSSL